MTTIKKFEDIIGWQKARELSKLIYSLTNTIPFSKDYGLVNQIRNSSGSIMDNIAEGFERSGTREFIMFLGFSKGSCGEVKSQLYRALDQKYIDDIKFKEAYNFADETAKIIGKFISYLVKTDIKGSKFLKEPEVGYRLTAKHVTRNS